MEDKNILNNLSSLSDDEFLYFCNDICKSYTNNTFKKDSIRNLCCSSKIIQLSSSWCVLVILLTLKDDEEKYKEFLDSLFELEINTLLPCYYFLKLRQERRFECKHPILGEYYNPSDEMFSYFLFKLNQLYIKLLQSSIHQLFSFSSLRVFYNLIKIDEYKMNLEYYNNYVNILNGMINNLHLYQNENSNYKYISTKLIKCYYRIIIDFYSNTDSAITNIPVNDILNKLSLSLFVDKSSQLYYYAVYYYTLLIITTTDDNDNENSNNLLSKITNLFPLNDSVSFLQLVLYEYLNNDQLMYDVLYIDLVFYIKSNEILGEEIMSNLNPIVMFNLYLAIFEYEVDDIYQIISSEESQIFLLFLLKFLKWCFNNKQAILQSELSLLYYRIISCLNELNEKFDLKNNGFSVLDKWINKNNL